MIRVALVLFLIGAACVAMLALAGDAGRATLVWLGWRIDTTAAVAVLFLLFGALVAAIFWRLVLWIASAPQRSALERAEQRRRQAAEALTRGFLAAAAGEGSEARRMAQRAAELTADSPPLVRVLAAQAATAAGDAAAARAAYSAMLDLPDMRMAGLRGLMQTALAQNERSEALRYAQEAYSLERTSRWAWRALLEDRLGAGDWTEALHLVKSGLDRKIVTPLVAERARAALRAALAASVEEAGGPTALDHALQAVRLKPGFAPGAVIAARLLIADGKAQRAAGVLEAAWKEAPHPAIWLAYRDLTTAETPAERGRRLMALAALNPDAFESRVLAVEAALVSGARADARAASERLLEEPVTARTAGLMARLASTSGDADGARVWMARGASAPHDPEWSDIRPDGRAFAYTPADWARLVSTYAETGALIHPRFERREPVISDLPAAPVAYPASQTFVRAADAGLTEAPIADDPGFYAGAFDDQEPAAVRPGERRQKGGRRAILPKPRIVK